MKRTIIKSIRMKMINDCNYKNADCGNKNEDYDQTDYVMNIL